MKYLADLVAASEAVLQKFGIEVVKQMLLNQLKRVFMKLDVHRRAEGGGKGRPSPPKVILGGDYLPPKFPDN